MTQVTVEESSDGGSIGYFDDDDFVYGGNGVLNPYLADLKYLDAFVVENNILRVQIGLDPQDFAFRFNPSISIFLDTDRNPLTGAINWGTVPGAEYIVYTQILHQYKNTEKKVLGIRG